MAILGNIRKIRIRFFSWLAFLNNNYSNLLLVLGTYLGLYYIFAEFKELKKQNNYTLMAVQQNSRPILTRKAVGEDSTSDIVVFVDSTDKIFGFKQVRSFSNKGNGLSFYVGYLFFSSPRLNTNLRDDLLENRIDNSLLDFDRLYSSNRLAPMYPNESFDIEPTFIDTSKTDYYFYIILFYKDIYNNLFDTIQLYNLIYKGKYKFGDELHNIIQNYSFHQYTAEERAKLINVLMDKHKGLAEAISTY